MEQPEYTALHWTLAALIGIGLAAAVIGIGLALRLMGVPPFMAGLICGWLGKVIYDWIVR